MSEAIEGQEVEQQPQVEVTQTEAEANRQMLEAYEKARGNKPPAEVEAAPQASEVADDEPESQEVEVAEQQDGQAGQQKRLLVKDLKEELDALKNRIANAPAGADPQEVRKLHGMVGELNRNLQQLQSQLPKAPPPVDPLAAALEEAKKAAVDFPESAGPIVKALEALVAQKQPEAKKPEQPPVDIEKKVSEAVAWENYQFARRQLYDEHPDFDDVRKSDEFDNWVRSQPPQRAEHIRNVSNPTVAAKYISEFKESLKPKQQDSRQVKQERLAGNVAPTGVAQRPKSTVLPDEAGLMVGYKSIRRR